MKSQIKFVLKGVGILFFWLGVITLISYTL